MKTRPLSAFITARTISILGDRVSDIVLPLAILAAGGTALEAGLVTAAAQIPQVLAALHVGWAVDRRDQRHIMILSDVVRAICYLLIALVFAYGSGSIPVVGALALVTGIADTLFNTSAQKYLPSLVPRKKLLRANSWLEGSDAAATLSGPAFGGWLLQATGPASAFFVNAGSFIASAAFLFRMPPGVVTYTPPGATSSLLSGVAYIRRTNSQICLLAAAVYMHLLAAAVFLPFMVRARDELQLGAATIGVIASAAGVGGIISSLVVSRFISTRYWRITVASILAVNGSMAGLMSVFDATLLLSLAVLLLDGASALAFIMVTTVRQEISPEGVLGRVVAASTALTSLTRLIAIVGTGALITAFGPNFVLRALAASSVPIIAIMFTVHRPPVRRMRRAGVGTRGS